MKSNDHEHTAFKEYAKNEDLPLNEHPMFLLYTDTVTSNALDAFQAGYKAKDTRIATLEAQLKERESDVDKLLGVLQRRWISVNDEIPAERCLAYTPNDQDLGMQWRIIPDRLFKQVASDATHWMPLPSPPKEKE